jgi:hypothetical protein
VQQQAHSKTFPITYDISGQYYVPISEGLLVIVDWWFGHNVKSTKADELLRVDVYHFGNLIEGYTSDPNSTMNKRRRSTNSLLVDKHLELHIGRSSILISFGPLTSTSVAHDMSFTHPCDITIETVES